MPTEQVFTEIYEKNKWGGVPGEFCSGSGSSNAHVVSAYVSMLVERATREGFLDRTFVDLGCGDFRVGKHLLPLCSHYVGVDIVKSLVQLNQKYFGSATTRFAHLDIVKDELPGGDVCFIRQVFQHLSNEQISAVLPKLRRYTWIFITEHYPHDNEEIRPNLDKVHGGDVRVYENSGVYLSEPPFCVPRQALEMVLEVPWGSSDRDGAGVIRTFLFRPALCQDYS